jgi:hypothetical protein
MTNSHKTLEKGWSGMHGIDLTQDKDQLRALMNMVINLKVLHNVGKFLSKRATGSLYKGAWLHKFS